MDNLGFKVSGRKGTVIVIADSSRNLKFTFADSAQIQVKFNKFGDLNKGLKSESCPPDGPHHEEPKREVVETEHTRMLRDIVTEMNSKSKIHSTKPKTDISNAVQSTWSKDNFDFKVSDRNGHFTVTVDDSTHMETFDNTVHVQVILNKFADINTDIQCDNYAPNVPHKEIKREVRAVGSMDDLLTFQNPSQDREQTEVIFRNHCTEQSKTNCISELVQSSLLEPKLERSDEQSQTRGQNFMSSYVSKFETETHESVDKGPGPAVEKNNTEVEIPSHLKVEKMDDQKHMNDDNRIEISSESECDMQIIKARSGEKFNCEICQLSFKNRYRYDVHRSYHKVFSDTDEDDFMSYTESDSSGKDYTDEDSTYSPGLENEDSTTSDSDDSVEEGWAYNCIECGKGFPNSSSLSTHLRLMHRDKGLGAYEHCDVCYKRFLEREKRDTHRRNVHGLATEYVCCYCGLNYDSWKAYQVHMRIHMDEKPVEYECTFCGETFKSETRYQRHVSQHGFYCEVCKKVFEKKSQRNQHVFEVHLEDRDERGNLLVKKCPFCVRFFSTEKRLKIHKMTHLETYRKWKCDLCQKRFSSLKLLGAHLMRCHNPVGGNEKQQCPQCGELVSSVLWTDHLNRHKRKPLACSTCQRQFFRAPALRRHMLRHTNSNSKRPVYRCELCAMCLSSKDTLYTHLKAHVTQKFSCSFCDMIFFNEKRLQTHVERKHHTIYTRTECEKRVEKPRRRKGRKKKRVCAKVL